MKSIETGNKAILWKTLAALVIMALCAVPMVASFPAHADDGAAPPPTADTAAAPEDTGAASPPLVDTAAAPEDTAAAPEDTAAAPEDTAAAPEDTGAAPEDTAAAPEDAGSASGDATTLAAASTNQFNYLPGETADISGAGFTPGANVNVTLTKPDGSSTQWAVAADDSGNIATGYELADGIEGVYYVQLSDGTTSASTAFTDPAVILRPQGGGSTTQLSDSPSSGPNYQKVDDNVGGTGGNDGSSTYVYTYDEDWKTDVYNFENLPHDFDLGGCLYQLKRVPG